MPEAPLAVHAWPDGLAQALADLRSGAGMTVLSVPTLLTAHRTDARHAIRHAVQHTLAAFLDGPAASVALLSRPGQAPQVAAPGAGPVHLSISHLPSFSVAAISLQGAVGVDVMAIDMQSLSDWANVARDYLGPLAAKALQQTPPRDRPAAFAHAWTALEACLKCLGLGLTEWTPDLAARLQACTVISLTLPAGSCGVLAFQPAAKGQHGVWPGLPLTPPASSAGTRFR